MGRLMAEHTPGPWTYRPADDGFELDVMAGDLYVAAIPDIPDETEANARLIAAAPRMADYIRLHAERDPEARAILQEAGVL